MSFSLASSGVSVADHQYSQKPPNNPQSYIKTPPTLSETKLIQTPPESKAVVQDSWEDINVADDDPPTESSPKTTAAATPVETVTSASDKKRTPEAANNETNEEVRLKPSRSSSSKGVKVESGKCPSIQITPKAEDEKENVNIIFIGHVDAGKSTIGGHLM